MLRLLSFRLGILIAAIVAVTPLFAQRATWEFDLAFDEAEGLNVTLSQLASQGYRCARVARPDAPLVPRNVGILVGRPKGPRPPQTSDIRVVTGTPVSGRDRFERDINLWVSRGYELCGFTIAEVSSLGRQPYGLVAVMEKLDGRTPANLAYRVIHTTGRREEWQRLEQSAAEGFAVTHMVWRPQTLMSATSDIHYIVERRDGADRPMVYDLKFAGNENSLQKYLEAGVKAGNRVQAVWSGNDQISILFARPKDGAWDGAHEYVVDENSWLRTSTISGSVIRLLRFKDAVYGFFDKKGPVEDASNEGWVEDLVRRPRRFSSDEQSLIDKLNADGGRGYWPTDFTIRKPKAESDRLAVDVVLSRAKQ